MAYTLHVNLANPGNYGGKRLATEIKYIVVHMTGNDGDKADSNARYFKDNVVKASAHYFVDDCAVTQSVPDLSIAYSVGGKKYTDCAKTGGGAMYDMITNRNSLSVELCDTHKDGVVQAAEDTMRNAAALIRMLMTTYNVPITNVYRHFDVTGKHCPSYLMDATAWSAFKARIVAQKLSTPNDIAYRLAAEGIASASEYWMQRMAKEPVVLALCRNIANYTLQHSKGKGSQSLVTANDIAYRLLKAGIITDSICWRDKMAADKQLYALCRKAAEWTI